MTDIDRPRIVNKKFSKVLDILNEDYLNKFKKIISKKNLYKKSTS